MDKESLRSLADTLKSALKSGVVVLAGRPCRRQGRDHRHGDAGPVKRAPAGQLVKQLAPIVGGGGGGRADFAEAGGKDPREDPRMLAEPLRRGASQAACWERSMTESDKVD